jgi:LysM repeat protein
MKKLLGNSCAKGCLVYVVAFVIVLALTAMGLGGLKGKFSTNVQGSPPQASIYSVPTQPAGNSSPPSSNTIGNTGGGPATAASNSAQPPAQTEPAQVAQPAQAAQPAVQPTAQPNTQPKIQVQIQTQGGAQGGAITGEASLPFYVVQPDDTLWSIAQGFNVQVDTLRVVNSLTGDLIKPGQLIYLPQPGQAQQPQSQQAQQPQQQAPPVANPPAQPAQQAPTSQQPASDVPASAANGD